MTQRSVYHEPRFVAVGALYRMECQCGEKGQRRKSRDRARDDWRRHLKRVGGRGG